MRFRFQLPTLCALLLAGCAYQGTIVQKDETPLPFSHSYGLDGSYAFLLRDNTGTVRRQIVTPEVYNQYAVGDYFNDLQPQQQRGDGKSFDGKTVMTAMMSKVPAARRTAAARTPAAPRTAAAARQSAQARTASAKPAKPKKAAPAAVAQARPSVQPVRKALPVDPRPIELPPQILRARPVWDSEIAYVSVPRCR